MTIPSLIRAAHSAELMLSKEQASAGQNAESCRGDLEKVVDALASRVHPTFLGGAHLRYADA
jgi:hypothetical protein